MMTLLAPPLINLNLVHVMRYYYTRFPGIAPSNVFILLKALLGYFLIVAF